MNDISWEEIQNLFPVNQELIWLNNCGTTPASKIAVNSVTQFLEEYSRKGVYSTIQTYSETKRYILETLAKLLECSANELSVVHNTSEGMNFISHGLSLKENDEILLLENEYPSNVYPWEHWEEKGVRIRFIPNFENQEKFLQNFPRYVTKNTKVVSLSAVHWCTGFVIPLQEIGSFCEEKEIEFVVDGAQGVGNIPINLKRMKIGYMPFSGWKWLLGPLGVGGLYISQDKLQKLKLIFKGTDSVVHSEEYLPYKKELKSGTDRYEFSTANFNDWVYWKASLGLLQKIGWEKAMKRIWELTQILSIELQTLGFQVNTNSTSQPSGILTAWHDQISSQELVRYLKKQNIITAHRIGKIRFSPHVYNSEEQIQKVIDSIHKYISANLV